MGTGLIKLSLNDYMPVDADGFDWEFFVVGLLINLPIVVNGELGTTG